MKNTESKRSELPDSQGQTQALDGSVSRFPPDVQPQRHGGKILQAIGILAAIALGLFLYWNFFMRGFVSTDDARFAGHLVDLAPEISGRLVEVLAIEGQAVHSGQVIFRIDAETAQAVLNQAKAALESAKANFDSIQSKQERIVHGSRPEEIKASDAIVKRLQNEEDYARLEFERMQNLKNQGAVSQNDLDQARTAYESARQSRNNATQNLALLQEGSRQEDIDGAKADVEMAQSRVAESAAALSKAQEDLARCYVKAPFNGWVVRRWRDPGDMLLSGQPVISLFDPSTLHVDANIEEKFLNRIKVGDDVDIRVDAYPRLRLKGKVEKILRATNSEFSLIPAEGVSGTFIKVTQRVPLRISVSAPTDLPLGPGLSVLVRIHASSSAIDRPADEIAREE